MNNPAENGNNSLLVCIILSVFTWLTPDKVDLILKIVTALGAITATFFAIRYHIYATDKVKKEIEKLDDE